jgi:hypothetical protein
MNWRNRVKWGLALAAAALLQVARALEASLGRLHAPHAEGAGYRLLTNAAEVNGAFRTWSDGATQLSAFRPLGPEAIIRLHVVADSLFVVCLIAALVAGRDRSPTRWSASFRNLLKQPWGKLALAGAVLDLLGNGGEAWIANASSCCRSTVARPIGWLWLAERAVVAVALIALLVTEKKKIADAARAVWNAPAVLRLLLVLDVGFVAVLSVGAIGSQTEDVVQRWLEGDWIHGVLALAGYVVFVAAVWSEARVKTSTAPAPAAKLLVVGGLLLAAGAVVFTSGVAGRGAGLLVLGAIVVLIGLGQLALNGEPQQSSDKAPPALRAAVAAIPAFAIGLLLVRTGTNHLVVRDRGGLLLLLGAIALALGAVAWKICGREATAAQGRLWFFLGLACVVTTLTIAVAGPFSDDTGSLAVLLFALADLTAVAVLVRALFPSSATPVVFRAVGFDRTPAVTLLVVWVAVASAVNGAGNGSFTANRITYYDVRTTARQSVPIGAAPKVDPRNCLRRTKGVTATDYVRDQFCTWVAEQPGGETTPLVMVIASGGGVRAAGWTAKVIDCLFFRDEPVHCSGADAGRPDRWPTLFAANGASGGSVGIASALAERLTSVARIPDPGWFRAQQRQDTLTPLLGHAVLRDSFLGLFGLFPGMDRSAALEDAWSRRWADQPAAYCLDDGRPAEAAPLIGSLGFVTLRDRCARAVPLLLFNGTDTNTGRRVNIAPMDLDDSDRTDRSTPPDLIDYLGAAQDLPLFSAAFLSARFPFVTDSGRLPSCRTPGDAFARACPLDEPVQDRVLNVVDGGYVEDSGSAQVLELWQQILPLVEAYNDAVVDDASRPSSPVRPVLVEIENGELASDARPPVASTAGEILQPLTALLHVSATARSGTRDAATAGFAECGVAAPTQALHIRFSMYEHPGRTLPLGWTLARDSLDSLDRQFAIGENKDAAACFAAAVPAR